MTPLTVGARPVPGAPVAVTHARSAGRRETVATLGLALASRVLILVAGCTAVALLGTNAANVHAFDPQRLSTSLGPVGNLLAAPAVRWDAIWYLQIAHHGYATAPDAGFFPLYPVLIRAVSAVTVSAIAAGIVVSVLALAVGLELVRRLTELELGPAVARATVPLIAFGPVAVYYSAVYTESLFLALSAGTLYAARRGRWSVAGAVGALAALSRPGGVLLIVPVVLMFLYGPRSDARGATGRPWWRPCHRLSPEILWAALIPAGSLLFAAYLAARGYGLDGSLAAQRTFWHHEFVSPLEGVWDGVRAAWLQLRLEVQGVHLTAAQADALPMLATLGVTLVALVGVFRRMPAAYGAYVLLSLLQVLSAPTGGDPLRDLARYASVWFPLFMWAGAWAVEHRAQRRLVIISAALLVLTTAQFACWSVVGTARL
jgi:Mannosyltransferase (PIG-V)